MMTTVFAMVENIVEKDKMLVKNIFSFSHNVFKSLLFQSNQNFRADG